MKKILSLLLCAVLLASCAAAAAEGEAAVDFRDRFQLKGTVPDGYKLSILSQDELTLEGEIAGDNAAAPVMKLFISFNESYANVASLNDLSADALEQIMQSFTEEYTMAFDRMDTDSGIPLLVARETGESADFLDFYTIFRGHEIELWLYKRDDAANHTLTAEQLDRCKEFVRSLQIIPFQ